MSTPTFASNGPVSVISPFTTFGTTIERFCWIGCASTADAVCAPPSVGVVVIGIFTVPASGSWPDRFCWIPSSAEYDSPNVRPVSSPGVMEAFQRSASLNPPEDSASKVMSPTEIFASIVSARSETRLCRTCTSSVNISKTPLGEPAAFTTSFSDRTIVSTGKPGSTTIAGRTSI